MQYIDLINIALYIPFFILFLIFGIAFCVTGYKNGVWRSLTSLIATVCALLISIGLGKLLGQVVSGPLSSFIFGILSRNAEDVPALVESGINIFLQLLLTLLFYGLILIISAPIMKSLGKRLPWQRLQEAPGAQVAHRFAGLGIRMIDAFVLILALLLPLYGGLAHTMPSASLFVGIAEADSPALAQVLHTVESHPTVKVYTNGPAASACSELTDLSVSGQSLDMTAIASGAEGILSRFMAFDEADGPERFAALEELVRYLREEVINEPWSYSLICIVREELQKSGDPMAIEFAELLVLSEEEFLANANVLLDFVDYALSNGFITFYKSSDYESLPPEFYEKLGSLINYSEQAIVLKKWILADSARELFLRDLGHDGAVAAAAAEAYVDRYIPNTPTAPALQRREGEAFMRIVFSIHTCDILEGFARHPAVGYAGTKQLLTEAFIRNNLFHIELTDNISGVMPILQHRLASYESAPLRNDTFTDYIDAIFQIDGMLRKNVYGYFRATDALLKDLTVDLKGSFFVSNHVDGERVRSLLYQALNEAQKTPGVMGWVDLYGVYYGTSQSIFEIQPVDFGDLSHFDLSNGYAPGGTVALSDADVTIIFQ